MDKYPNGKTRTEIIYIDAVDHSHYNINFYYPSGNLAMEATMKHGKFIDSKYWHYEEGQVATIEHLSCPCDTGFSKCDGEVIKYYKNGHLSRCYKIKNHHYNGEARIYDHNGRLLKEYTLKDDTVKNGEYKEFYEINNVSFKATFKNDTIVGFSYCFTENGDTAKYYNNYKGNMDFPYKIWLDSGRTLTGNYSDTAHETVTWVWREINGKEIKRKIVHPIKNAFVVPDL